MRRSFELPDLGEGLAEAELVEWHVAAGDAVLEDQELVDVQTDKAIVTVPCPVSGTLLERHGEPGDTVSVGAVLAVFETTSDSAGPASPSDPPPPPLAPSADSESALSPPAPASVQRRVAAAPSVRRMARERGIDLATVSGSGPGGRILSTDLEAPTSPADATAARPSGPDSAAPHAAGETPLRGVRRATARTMTAGWQSIPHIFDFREADATALMEARAALKAEALRAGDDELAAGLTPLVLLIKIAALALAAHPQLHGHVDAEREIIVTHQTCHLGIAVSTPDGLLTPVLRDVGALSLADIARQLRELSGLAKDRRLTAQQLSGATFLVNNLGALGTWYGTPLIPPGLGGNLGYGRVVERPVVREGHVVVGQVLPLSISADHRLVDGDVLAAFAATVVRLVESPVLLLGAP